MKRRNSAISLILAVSMILSLVFSAAFSLTASAAETDPKKINKFIVDFRSENAQIKNSEIYRHKPTAAEPDPNTGGLYSFDTAKSAMKLEYAESKVQNPFRIMTKIKGLTAEYKYWVVVYAAETDKPYDIYLHNSPRMGQRVDVVKGAKSTDGKFVASAPFDISTAVNGTSLLSRWMTGATVNTLNFVSEDKNADFYIKEFGFFKSAEDAKAYYSIVDLDKAPTEYMSDAEKTALENANKPTPAAPSTPAPPAADWDGVGTFKFTFNPPAEDTAAPDTSLSEDNLPAPIIINFESAAKFNSVAKMNDFEGDTEGAWKYVTAADGTECLQLVYKPYGSWKPFRMMPSFTAGHRPTANHRYVRVTYMTNDIMANTISFMNNATGQGVVLVENTAASQGNFVRSNAVDIAANDILARFVRGAHCTFMFSASTIDSDLYIKEIAFFASERQAYDYYGDKATASAALHSVMSFAKGGSGTTTKGDTYGKYVFNDDDATLDIVYAEKTNHAKANYMAKIAFTKKEFINRSHKYVRVLYSASQPASVTKASMYLYNDANGESVRLVENLTDTNGRYVLGDTTLLHSLMMDRFSASGNYTQTMHNSLVTNVNDPGATYKIKAIYFFPTRADAESFTIPSDEHVITVNGNPIEKYRIVISENAPTKVVEAANLLANRIRTLTGYKIAIADDSTAPSGYEILVGPSTRAKTTARLEEFKALEGGVYRMWSYVDGNDLIVGSVLPYNTKEATNTFARAFLFEGIATVPDEIHITEKHSFNLTNNTIQLTNFWSLYENVQSPVTFTEDFDTDDGYFNEENGQDSWKYENGTLAAKANGSTLSYIHVFEPDVSYKARIKYTAERDGEMGLMLRYNSADAWVKAGYDFALGQWYIKDREGLDFFEFTRGAVPMTVTPDTWYDLEFTVDGPYAVLSVNGVVMISVNTVTQLTPGRIAVYAEDADVAVDDVNLVLLSGEGTIWKDVSHTRLPGENYREGGTVIEMKDGSLRYLHNSNISFKSLDGGKTWTQTDNFSSAGYPNVLRLNNGDLLQIVRDGNHTISQTSSDDGKTWVKGGKICYSKYGNNTTAGAGNMNDKLMQSAPTSHWPNRIFYGQNYEGGPVEGRSVFCEFYYSDDNGKTWTKSETDSWEIVGNEKQTHFGEAKMLECADGTIRMYNSWNRHSCVVYTESTDGGKTFGPLQFIPEMECSCSSMQFARDVYADNDYTYYMVWVNSEPETPTSGMTRARLTLAKTTDGKNWTVLGDVWRWESNYKNGGAFINHVVDPFIYVTEDSILVGSGFSEYTALDGEPSVANWHQAQRQHIYSIPKDSLPEGKALNKFTDVPYGTDIYEAVTFVADNGLFNGTGENSFSPNTNMNRAMFVTVLSRLAKTDTKAYAKPTFGDVAAGQWYTEAIGWAAANGVVNGLGAGEYGPFNEVTVQQACVILARYANYAASVNGTGKTSADFADGASVASWAAKEVDWAIANGIYTGANGKLDPGAPATRGLVAVMFNNYVKAFVK